MFHSVYLYEITIMYPLNILQFLIINYAALKVENNKGQWMTVIEKRGLLSEMWG